MKAEAVLHFTIPVKDLDRSEAFYTGILGLTRVRRNDHMVFMRCNDSHFVLTLSENPIDPNVGDKHDIHTAFVFRGKNYDAMKTLLAEKNIRVFKEEDRHHGTFRGRSAYFHDPDRNVIEIMDLQGAPVAE
ncbi:MAG: VOC family protein [Beijerinckiaceae bacterium]|jgi:catechol 2,3-dioxygenase-like lactoylglutathione lyase family enzyme|nr:VOC family protein [Beijerinckiaceae bacterium]